MISISVIIPTYNGAHKLPGILNTLKVQSFKDFELIMVVDGSTDNTINLLKSEQLNFLNLKIIEQENGGRAKVRNRGAREANGEFLIFFDDDIRLLPETLEKHYSFLKENSAAILVGPAKIDPVIIKNDDFSGFRLNVESKWATKNSGDIRNVNLHNYVFTTQNLSMSKETFFKIGGFDERLRDSEDFDLSMQAIIKGVPIFFNPSMVVWHDDFMGIQSFINRQVEYIESKELLVRLKPEYKNMHLESFTYSVKKKGFFKIFLMRLLAYNDMWNFIFTSPLFFYFPNFLRYKIYDWVTFSSIYFKINSIK